MTLVLYLELNLMCIFILGLLWVNVDRSKSVMMDGKVFRIILLSVMMILLVDILEGAFEGWTFPGARTIITWINAFYFFLTGLIGFLWAIYTDVKINESVAGIKRRIWIYSIPFLILMLGSFLTPWTQWLFYIDEGNRYHRGRLFLIQAVIAWGYLAFPAVFSFLRGKREKLRSKRKECQLISLFILPPFFGSIIQMTFYGIPMLWVSVTCSLLILFINIQNGQISKDALTNISNRGQLNRYLASTTSNLKITNSLYLLIIDVDSFKAINDTFGHAIGDAALIQVADILKNVCCKTCGENFLARYGGDEFALVCIRKNGEPISKIQESIEEETTKFNEKESVPYHLSLSVGYSQFGKDGIYSVDELIAASDAQMYQNKESKKNRL